VLTPIGFGAKLAAPAATSYARAALLKAVKKDYKTPQRAAVRSRFSAGCPNQVNAALGYYLEHRRRGWDRHFAARMSFDVSQVQVRCVIRAICVHVEALPLSLAVADRHRAPFH
jgi:hypothetical protein